mgnify:CR=1 FL=1
MGRFYLLTFLPSNAKSVYFRHGVGYKSGTQWLFEDAIPHSLINCPYIKVDEVNEDDAFAYINKGVIFNDYAPGEAITLHGSPYEDVKTGSSTTENNEFLSQIRDIVAEEISSIHPNIESKKADDYKEDELTLTELQNKVFNSQQNNLSSNKVRLGQKTEQLSDSVLDDNVKLLKKAKKPDHTDADDKPVEHEVIEHTEDNSFPEISTEEKTTVPEDDNILKKPLSVKDKKRERIAHMLDELKESQK